MASSSPLDIRKRTVATLLALVFFLFAIFLFTKRTLEPSLSLYRSSFPQTTTALSQNHSLQFTTNAKMNPIPDSEPNVVFTHNLPQTTASVSQNHSLQFTTTNANMNPIPDSEPNVVSTHNLETAGTTHNLETAVSKIDDKNIGVPEVPNAGKSDEEVVEIVKECDLFMGRWVRDEEYPIYKPASCPYVDEAFDCQNNGRKDSQYLKWRWKPDHCDLPRFNATDFLRRLRGKRLMLVGDSMNRNQFESILCLLREGLHNKSKMYEIHGYKITKGRGYYVFKFEDYNCTVEFVRSHFLVREGVHINAQGNSNPTLSIDRIDKTSGRWKRADILVFNTGHWWTHGKTARGKNYYKEGDYIYPKFDAVEAYRRALKTWAKWIDEHVNPKKQLVLYRGYSSAHFRGGDWDSGGTCQGETQPALSGSILNNYPLKMKIVEEAIGEMKKVSVKLLNVTRLTNFRKDGHPSVYGKNATAGRKVSGRRQDCSHWCLPGVPDSWNEFIYATLVFQQSVFKS